jgi:arginyl-tRNA synthetase
VSIASDATRTPGEPYRPVGFNTDTRLLRVTPAVLADLVRCAAEQALHDHGIGHTEVPTPVTLRRPRNPEHGDYTSELALRLAGPAGVTPRELAGWLAKSVAEHAGVSTAEVAGPGFLNIRLAPAAHGEIVREVLAQGERYGGAEPLPRPRGEIRLAGISVNAQGPAEAIGADAATFALAKGLTEVDPARWCRRVDENPVYFVQYAHARLSSVLRNATELEIAVPTRDPGRLGLARLTHRRESELIRTIGEFGGVVETSARRGDPSGVARYLERLAGDCHRFQDDCRVLPQGDEEATELTVARLALCSAARQVLGNGLRLLGVSAPERL